MHPQPNDSTCGPTCLHAVYRYYGEELPLNQVIAEVEPLETGGTLAVHLATHALKRGYSATIYTYNLQLFDPTWFTDPPPSAADLAQRLEAQAGAKKKPKLQVATDAYLEYLARGGDLRFEELGPQLIRRYLTRHIPILTGLSATYLYSCARETGDERLTYDDVRGVPVGHFVVLYGYARLTREIMIADPLQDNPLFGSHHYSVAVQRALGAILLGVLTYDANLLIIEPRSDHRRKS